MRDYTIAFIYFIFHFLMTTHSFFWIQCELILGISLMLFYISFLDYYFTNRFSALLFILVSAILLINLVFIHPLIIIPFSFLMLYRIIQSGYRPKIQEILSFIVFLGLYYWKQKLFTNYYDTGAMENVQNVTNLFPQYLYGTSARNFLHYLTVDYYMLLISIPLSIGLVYKRKWAAVTLFIVYFTGTIFLINACYIQGAEQFYLEGQYSIVTIFIAAITVGEFKIIPSKWHPLFLVVIVSLFMHRVITSSTIYSKRIQYYGHLISLFPHKAILAPNDRLNSNLRFTWGSSYEVWLLSTIESKKTSSILIHENPAQFDSTGYKPTVFLTNWRVFDYQDLNPKYFIFKDTSVYKKYQFVNSN